MSVKERPSRRPAARDMDATPFTAILDKMLSRTPGAYGAALVDGEGETVDYAGLIVPYDIRVAAAHLQILLRQLQDIRGLGAPKFILARGPKKTVVARMLPEDYVLAVLYRRRAGFVPVSRAFEECERELAREAGWPAPSGRAWFAVDVRVDPRGRPVCVEPDVAIEVLGTVMDLPGSEQGFRVRTRDGHELTLVRETKRTWFADEDLAGGAAKQKR